MAGVAATTPQHNSDMIRLWSTGDPTRLLHLARQIESHEGWKPLLSQAECSIVRHAIEEGGKLWEDLLSTSSTTNNAEFLYEAEVAAHSSPEDSGVQTPTPVPISVETSLHTPRSSPHPQEPISGSPSLIHSDGHLESSTTSVPAIEIEPPINTVALALKVRYILYEKSVDYLFGTTATSNGTSFEVDFSFLDEEETDKKLDGDEDNSSSPEKAPPARKVDEDDYDDDDDDEDGEEEEKDEKEDSGNSIKPNPLPNDTVSVSLDSTPNKKSSDPDSKITTNGIITPADTPTSSDNRQLDEALLWELYNTYQTLDSEKENLYLRQPKHEELEARDDDANEAMTGKLSQLNFGAANLSLKHLLAAIDEKRQELSVTDMELRNLISEVRKNRSKWASEDRIGQEELYEAAEKAVMELRAYTEHSTAFLNRVNKRDAPNYFNIIKNPMDLGTVMKKLKALQYRSKKEFVDDLMLIWENCFTFNADPQHYLRKHAAAMQKKTRALIPLIPDVTIKSKTDIEAEEASIPPRDMSVDVDMESEDGGDNFGMVHRSSSRAAAGGKTVNKSTPSSMDHDHDEELRSRASQGLVDRLSAPPEEEQPCTFDYEVIPTMPETLWNVNEQLKALESEQFETAVDFSNEQSPFLPVKSGLTTKMDANLGVLQQIRKICSKISVVRRMQQHPHLYSAQLRPYNPEKLDEKDVDFESRLPGHSDTPKEVIEACLQRSVAKVAMHTGYEDCHMLALEGLTTVAADFMQRLGRTLCLYMESNRGVRRYSLEDVILQTLHENGTYDLGCLEGYMRDDIDRFGGKLKDVRDRIGTSLTEILKPALSGDNGDTQFDDGSQEFISGAFSDDIGEDFFGFKELGLDEELGLSSFSVPLHLLHSRLQANARVQTAPILQSKVVSAPLFEPFTYDKIEKQIGLLQPFFVSRFEKYERDGALIEDENLPPKQRNQRPKLPPTGKIAVVKKRSSENSFGGSDKKKKKSG